MEYLSSILVGVIVVAIIAAVIYTLISDRKKGKGGCGCGCSSCPNSGACHGAKKQEKTS